MLARKRLVWLGYESKAMSDEDKDGVAGAQADAQAVESANDVAVVDDDLPEGGETLGDIWGGDADTVLADAAVDEAALAEPEDVSPGHDCDVDIVADEEPSAPEAMPVEVSSEVSSEASVDGDCVVGDVVEGGVDVDADVIEVDAPEDVSEDVSEDVYGGLDPDVAAEREPEAKLSSGVASEPESTSEPEAAPDVAGVGETHNGGTQGGGDVAAVGELDSVAAAVGDGTVTGVDAVAGKECDVAAADPSGSQSGSCDDGRSRAGDVPVRHRFDGEGGLARAHQLIFDHLLGAICLAELHAMSAMRARDVLAAEIDRIIAAEGYGLEPGQVAILVDNIGDELVGLGPLDAILVRDDVTEICVAGGGAIHVVANGRTYVADVAFKDGAHLARRCQIMARLAGMAFDADTPVAEFVTDDGEQVMAVRPPVCGEVMLSLKRDRRAGGAGGSLSDLVACGAMRDIEARTFAAAVRARRNIIVAAPVDCDATPVVSALLGALARTQKVAIVEDRARVDVAGLATVRFARGAGEADVIARLVEAYRPDRIVYDRVASEELGAVLAAMAQGRGVMALMAARDVRSVLAQWEQGAAARDGAARRAMIAAGVDMIISCRRSATGGVQLAGTTLVTGLRDGAVLTKRIDFAAMERARPEAAVSAGVGQVVGSVLGSGRAAG